MGVLDEITGWPVHQAAAGITTATGPVEVAGDGSWRVRIASVSKILIGYASLIALEDGSLQLDQPAGPPGSTVRHLLAHASGLPFNGPKPLVRPGRRRIYSNTGIEALGETLAAATGMTNADYLREGVFEPLGMADSELRGSPAWGVRSNVDDLLRFGRELLAPTLVDPTTLAEAVTVQFPGLPGIVPGMGRYDDNPWGLSFEIKGAKSPHWTAPEGSPRTFGHFGGSGTFLWVDPDAALCCVALTDREFGDWAPPLWSTLSSHVLSSLARGDARQRRQNDG
ncbi:MAG TPA: serine hydrolase domain-containing protein [Acidimicrobiales bacterium]|jgi:CubicO group peptidase (beta-lactamase class C family)|nr:serine hydrolase domain-containing protein [Acidimicrobiales bacterium]